ncbi:MAG: glycosyltransferase [Anaerolineales bacterium]
MFHINTQPVSYSFPWNRAFEDRVRALMKGEYRAVYYYENPDNSTFRYRVYNMIQALEQSQHNTSAAFFTQDELEALGEIVDRADVLIVCRAKYSDVLNRVITKARSKGKRVLFDVDDLIFDPSFAHLVLNTLGQDLGHPDVWDFWFAYMGRIGATLELCERAITTNEFLARRIALHGNKPVSVVPNFLNQEQLEISHRIFQEKKSRGFGRNAQFHLGYFSGTPTHNKDFEILRDALVELLERDPRIVLRTVGYAEPRDLLPDFRHRIEYFPLQDFVNLQRLIGSVEVNLVPLQDNEFTNCKSELKYFEAGIVGTLSIASPVYTYAKAIQDGENGFLANSFEWSGKLDKLMDAMESYPVMAERAHSDCETRYAWYNQVDLIEQTLFAEPPTVAEPAKS